MIRSGVKEFESTVSYSIGVDLGGTNIKTVGISPEGKVLTLYYRAYDAPRRQIEAQRESFWQREQEVEFHIGAKRAQDVPAFKAWLVKRLATNGG